MTQTHKKVALSNHTLRLTFAYKDGIARLIRSERVEMKVPAAVTPPPQTGQSGFWFEVRDAAGNLLYHRPLHNPMRADVEVFSKESERTMARVPADHPEGEFTLLVPDLPDADTFVFHGAPQQIGANRESLVAMRSAPSQPLIRYSFAELRSFQIPAQDTENAHASRTEPAK